MNARPIPMAETQKLSLLLWLQGRARFGQGSPSDRDIARRFGLRSTDDALALVQSLVADGDITVEWDGNFRHLVLAEPVAPAGAAMMPRDAAEAARASVPPPAMDPRPIRAQPAPIRIIDNPRPPFVPVVTPPPFAPIAAPAPAPAAPSVIAEEEIMPTVSDENSSPRYQLPVDCSANDRLLIKARASHEKVTVSAWVLEVIRARLMATSPAAASRPATGKPRLSARVIRIANADDREFWAAVSMMIELGATALAEQQARP